jgi:hypothetical protein
VSTLSKYRFPPGKYAFHTTSPANIESIRNRGILRSEPTNIDTADIDSALEELGYDDPFPFDRSQVTYCHVDPSYVESVTNSELAPGDAIVVVDVEDIQASMYLADMSIISDLIDYRVVGPEVMMYADSPDEVVRLYQESIVSVDSGAEIASNPGPERSHTELVIDGDILPTAIVDVCGLCGSDDASGRDAG